GGWTETSPDIALSSATTMLTSGGGACGASCVSAQRPFALSTQFRDLTICGCPVAVLGLTCSTGCPRCAPNASAAEPFTPLRVRETPTLVSNSGWSLPL